MSNTNSSGWAYGTKSKRRMHYYSDGRRPLCKSGSKPDGPVQLGFGEVLPCLTCSRILTKRTLRIKGFNAKERIDQLIEEQGRLLKTIEKQQWVIERFKKAAQGVLDYLGEEDAH